MDTIKTIDANETTLLNIAMSLESYSTHPISNAIVDYAMQLNVKKAYVSLAAGQELDLEAAAAAADKE